MQLKDIYVDPILTEIDYENSSRKNLKIFSLLESNKLIFILGSPGQGKTSFCFKMLYDIINCNILFEKEVYYLHLRSFELSNLINDPLDNFCKYLSKSEDFNINLKNSLLILDGLDELQLILPNSQTKDIDALCEMILHQLANFEIYSTTQIIITSRYGYINFKDFNYKHITILQLEPFNKTQQLLWLQKYQSKHIECNIKLDHCVNYIEELINQPLLLHIIIASGYQLTNKIKNRSIIYDQLFSHLIKRIWDIEKHQLFSDIKVDDLRNFIRNIALAIFHTKQNYISNEKLENLDFLNQFYKKTGKIDKLKKNLKAMMITFYFRHVAIKNDEKNLYGIEFLHKSLQEYMVAEKFWVSIKEIIFKQNNEPIMNILFKKCLYLVSSCTLTYEISNYLFEISQNESENQIIIKDYIEQTLITLFETYDNLPIIDVINLFTICWIILSGLGLKKNYLENDNIKMAFLTFLRIRKFPIPITLCYQDLSNANFSGINFYNANLSNANLNAANLCEANLENANLTDVTFYKSNLIKTNLIHANLKKAHFLNSILIEANLENADLTNANFIECDLTKSNLLNANILTTNFSNTEFYQSTLSLLNISNNNLRNIDIKNIIWRD